jgi:hypothetical protein
MQDSTSERHLAAAKIVANHAVIGAGPLEFFADPGKTGFELSAINRIKHIYETYGFRTVSGEGGRPFGLKIRKVSLRCLALSASGGLRRGQYLAEGFGKSRGHYSPFRPAHLVRDQSAVLGLPLIGNGRALAEVAGSQRS